METIHVADVGDGLCVGIRTTAWETVQIDCGSQQGGKVAFDGLKRTLYKAPRRIAFVLTHFHIDHYNGLLYASLPSHHGWGLSPGIKEVYYPRIPDFKRKKEFILYLFTMNLRIFGSETGVMEYDLLKAITRINNGERPVCRPVSRGDVIETGGAALDVLWPPIAIDDRRALSAVRRALEDFERAMEEDEITRQLYERVARAEVPEEYSGKRWSSEEPIPWANANVEGRLESRGKLPDVVRRANRSLRQAANHMGLALFEDSRFLFLGDLDSFEISEIADHLHSRRRRNFYVVITPHHGTRWDESLREIDCFYSVSSVGSRLCSKLDPRIREISEKSLATWVNGDIILSMFLTDRIWSKLLWRYLGRNAR